jgi:hypothetical protein
MINGIRARAGQLAASAREVVSGAIAAAKNALGINSPSKVFYVIGTQTGQGAVNGLLAMTGKVGDAATRMAAAMMDPFDNLTVGGPSVQGMSTQQALSAITQPFGGASDAGLTTTRTQRQASTQAAVAGGATIQNTFNITEVGDATVTATRVVNRMVTAAGVFL